MASRLQERGACFVFYATRSMSAGDHTISVVKDDYTRNLYIRVQELGALFPLMEFRLDGTKSLKLLPVLDRTPALDVNSFVSSHYYIPCRAVASASAEQHGST